MFGAVDRAVRATDEKADMNAPNFSQLKQDDMVDDVYVPESEEEWLEEARQDRFVGFGERSTSQRIVVQMFTEEKRAEMDLEGLWDIRTKRRADKEERGMAETLEKLAQEKNVVDANGREKERIEYMYGASPGEQMSLSINTDPTSH